MSQGKSGYNATSTTITITLTNLASGTARQSTSIDNTSDQYVDASLYLAILMAAGTPSGDRTIELWGYTGTESTKLMDNVTGTDGAYTFRELPNLHKIDEINTPDAGAVTYKFVVSSMAAALGGMLTPFWGIIVVNKTGLAFGASGMTAEFRGVHALTE